MRRIDSLEIEEHPCAEGAFSYSTKDAREIVIRVTGNGFLYNMVRIIAGTPDPGGARVLPPRKRWGRSWRRRCAQRRASPRRLRDLCLLEIRY